MRGNHNLNEAGGETPTVNKKSMNQARGETIKVFHLWFRYEVELPWIYSVRPLKKLITLMGETSTFLLQLMTRVNIRKS